MSSAANLLALTSILAHRFIRSSNESRHRIARPPPSILPYNHRPGRHELGREGGGESPPEKLLRKDLAAGARVPLRSAAFRPTALPAPCRLLPSPLQPCPLHLPCLLRLPGLLLSGLLHCPHHLLVSLLSVELPHLLHPLLRRRALDPAPVSATVTVIHCEGVPPRRLTRPSLCPFHIAAIDSSRQALDLTHRFRMRFPKRDPLQALPGLQLRPKAPQHFRASPDRPTDLS